MSTEYGLPSTSEEALQSHLERLGVEQGDRLLVHSSLFALGTFAPGAAGVLRALLARVGPHGTLAFPAYTLDSTEDAVFDPDTTHPQAVGSLPAHVFSCGRAKRTANPLHSHLLLGECATRLNDEAAHDRSFGSGSIFDLFHAHEFKQLLLGVTLTRGGTYVHHLEAIAGVPYRRWKILRRNILRDGHREQVEFRYFARDVDRAVVNNFDPLEDELIRCGHMRVARLPFGTSSCVSVTALHATGLAMLRADPWCLVANS